MKVKVDSPDCSNGKVKKVFRKKQVTTCLEVLKTRTFVEFGSS